VQARPSRFLVVACSLALFSATAPLSAHEGHGHPGAQDGVLHYVVNPSHAVPALVTAAVALALGWTLFRRFSRRASPQSQHVMALRNR
jgi:hypothetical protein